MNGWTNIEVFRINGMLVVGKSLESAIKLYRDYCAPNSITIKRVEMVFGDSSCMNDSAIISAADSKAAETIALMTEENEELRKRCEDLGHEVARLRDLDNQLDGKST